MATYTSGSPASLQSLTAELKQHYMEASKMENVMLEGGPLLNQLLERADETFGGANMPIPIVYSGGGGVSSNFSVAAAGANPASLIGFQLTRASLFGVGLINGEAMETTEGSEDAMIDALALELDVRKRRVAQALGSYIFGDGTGVMGQVSSTQTITNTTLILEDPATAVNFFKGDWVQISATPGSAAHTTGTNATLGTTAGCAQIINVTYTGPNAGQITLTGVAGSTTPVALNTIWSQISNSEGPGGAGSVIYLAGDNVSTGQGSSVIPYNGANSAVVQGLLAWCPIGGPASSGDNFFGVNRYQNSFAYGNVIDATAAGLNLGSIREALTLAVSQLHQVSAKPDLIVLNPVAFYNLSLSLQSQNTFPATGSTGGDDGMFGFATLKMPTPHGTLEVVSDPRCAPYINVTSLAGAANTYSGAMTAFILETDTLGLFSKGPIPHVFEKDIGNWFIRLQTADQVQFQLKAYPALASRAPNHMAVVLLPNG